MADITTTRALEFEVQRQWRLRPHYSHVQWFDALIDREFVSVEQQCELQQRDLQRIVTFAVSNVAYYHNLFARRRLKPTDIQTVDDLAKLPLLSQSALLEHAQQLQAVTLPSGERIIGRTLSSGTTGRPKQVLMTATSNLMFSVLAQRQYRIYRFDPLSTFAKIRWAHRLVQRADGTQNPDGETVRIPAWRYVGQFFETGPEVGFNVTNSVEQQIDWLQNQPPQYLQSYAGTLEHLALACDGHWPVESLKAVQAISEQLTPQMRSRIESTLGVPVQQNYGLNEIGMVAVRCPAGRYHTHTEHCLVEIVDDEGQPCVPGERGRIVVTGLRNLAMPLLRYDTDDTAIAYETPCPCGRTLPSFGHIAGRYRRYSYLPAGTVEQMDVIHTALETVPAALIQNLRQYQLHQYRDHRFELRLLAAKPMPQAFKDFIQTQVAANEAEISLEIVEVNEIARSTGGKFQYVTSDFFPTADLHSE